MWQLKMSKNKEIRVAKSALDLSKNEAFLEATKDLEATYIKAWKESHIENEEARDKLYLAVNVLNKIQTHLQIYIDNGQIHEAETKKKIKKDFK